MINNISQVKIEWATPPSAYRTQFTEINYEYVTDGYDNLVEVKMSGKLDNGNTFDGVSTQFLYVKK